MNWSQESVERSIFQRKNNYKFFRCDYSQYPSEPCFGAVCIPLTKGRHCLVDADCYEKIREFRWYFGGDNYATTKPPKNSGISGSAVKMHKILFSSGNLQTDHINRDRLDNRIVNLRTATRSQNCINAAKKTGSKNPYKGVKRSSANKWEARVAGAPYIGKFNSPEDAATAYNLVAYSIYGDFAHMNTAFTNKGE